MIDLLCSCRDCIYRDFHFEECMKGGSVHVEEIQDEDEFGRPKCFSSYKATEEYSNEYWAALKDTETGELRRERRKGAKIVVEGITLYTSDRLPPREEWSWSEHAIWCTEATTGIGVSLHNVFKPENMEIILKTIREAVPVKALPVKFANEGKETLSEDKVCRSATELDNSAGLGKSTEE